jgi:hypothetical protein
MQRSRLCFLGAGLLLLAFVHLAPDCQPNPDEVWYTPECSLVKGTAAITFSNDDGQTLAPTSGTLNGVGYTDGLIALDLPNTLLATYNSTILYSEDAGCSWRESQILPGGILKLVKAPGERAYAWSVYDPLAFQITLTDGRPNIRPLTPPVDRIFGLGTDPHNPDRLRIGGPGGLLIESSDAGQNWSKIGQPPEGGQSGLDYFVGFDPANLDHVIYGGAVSGAFVSFDGGKNWTQATGLSQTGVKANAMSVALSPADPQVVWLMAIDLEASDEGRHIFRSIDGGLTFRAVIDPTADVTITNGTSLFPHPTAANILYFQFGTSFMGTGTNLYRYDANTDQLTFSHNDYHGIGSIAFSPADPQWLYLGLEVEYHDL